MLKAGTKGLRTAFLKLCSEEQILRDVEELMETAFPKGCADSPGAFVPAG